MILSPTNLVPNIINGLRPKTPAATDVISTALLLAKSLIVPVTLFASVVLLSTVISCELRRLKIFERSLSVIPADCPIVSFSDLKSSLDFFNSPTVISDCAFTSSENFSSASLAVSDSVDTIRLSILSRIVGPKTPDTLLILLCSI